MECAREPDAITAKSLPQVGICQPQREGKLGRQPCLGAGGKGFLPLPFASLHGRALGWHWESWQGEQREFGHFHTHRNIRYLDNLYLFLYRYRDIDIDRCIYVCMKILMYVHLGRLDQKKRRAQGRKEAKETRVKQNQNTQEGYENKCLLSIHSKVLILVFLVF